MLMIKDNGNNLTKNIILLGGSNSVMVNGLQKGLKQMGINLTNLALGATTSIQNLYEILRDKNKTAIDESDLIITESNINDIGHHHCSIAIPIDTLIRNICWLYEQLYLLDKKILVLILPRKFNGAHIDTINNAHRYYSKKFGFNVVDMQCYYRDNNLFDFAEPFLDHQMNCIMRTLGENIIKNLNCFELPKKDVKIQINQKFFICTPKAMCGAETLEPIYLKNSMFSETAHRLQGGIKLQFPKTLYGYTLVGFHAWNDIENRPQSLHQQTLFQSSIVVNSTNKKIIKATSAIRLLHVLNNEITIDEKTNVAFNDSDESVTEFSGGTPPNLPDIKKLNYIDIIDFLLVKQESKMSNEFNLDELKKMDIKIDGQYDFNHIIPPIAFFKELIEEYCSIVLPKHLSELKKQLIERDKSITSLCQENNTLKSQIEELHQQVSNHCIGVNAILDKNKYGVLEKMKDLLYTFNKFWR